MSAMLSQTCTGANRSPVASTSRINTRAIIRPISRSALHNNTASSFLNTSRRPLEHCPAAADSDNWEGTASFSEENAPESAPRDDDALPDSLTDALQAAAMATHLAMDRDCQRCIVEILLPEFWDPLSGPIYAEEGDQQRFWKLTRRFIDNMVDQRPDLRIKAIYPDAGVAAMLRNQWTDAAFSFSSLNDRKPVTPEDELVILAAPDPPGLDALMRISRGLEPGQTLVMFNPRLASGDVGVGLNVRRMRENFLKDFATTYSLRPVGDVGSVFRKYPGMWQVFVQDLTSPGRYVLAAERPSRPGGEDLDLIIMEALGGSNGSGEGGVDGEGKGPGFGDKIGLVINDLQRFMRALSQ